MPPSFRLLFVPLLAALLLPNLSEAAKRRPPPDVVEDALAYAASDRVKAIALLEGALVDGVSESDVDVVELHAGEQQRLAGNLDQAHEHFRAVVQRLRKGPDHEAARLGMALVAASKNLDANTVDVLKDVSDKDALPTQAADKYLALTIQAARASNPSGVTQNASRALAFSADDPEQRARIDARLAQLAGADSENVGNSLASPASASKTPVIDALVALEEGDEERAKKLAASAANSSDPETAAAAKGLLRSLEGADVQRDRIAVLLPLTGKYAAVGKQVQQALEYGFGSSSRKLVTYDSGATAETAVAALEKAVLTDGAIAVVGPLLSGETDAVVAAADALHVPLVSLSQTYEGEDADSYVFQGMYTRRDQIEALVGYLIDEKAFTRFATFHPDNAFGSHAAEVFAEVTKAKGGQLMHQAAYDANSENILPFAKKLGKRSGSLRALRAEAEAQGGNARTVVLPPVIDFDALFLPESAPRTPLAAAALAYEEFPMGDFRPKRSSPTIPLLGLSSWNTEALIAAGNEYTRNSLFTDVFSDSAKTDPDFSSAYKSHSGRTPSSLEAATVDVGKIVAAAAKSQASSRPAFRQALVDASVSDSITGASGFDPETQHLEREMHILTITRTSLEKVATVKLD